MSTEFERTQQAILLSNIGQNLQLWDVQSKLAGVRASSAATAQASRDAAWAAEKTERIAAARERRELDAVAREERENELREIVFKAETNFRQIEKNLSLSPPTSFYWAKRTKIAFLDENEIATASFRSYEDKERVHATFETASRVIGVCEQRVSESDRRDVEKCLEYESQIQPLEFLTNFTRENEARRAQLETELAEKAVELHTVQSQVEELQKSRTATAESSRSETFGCLGAVFLVICLPSGLILFVEGIGVSIGLKWGDCSGIRISPIFLGVAFILSAFVGALMARESARARRNYERYTTLTARIASLDREMQGIRERLSDGAADPVLATEAGRIYSLFPFLRDMPSAEYARMLQTRRDYITTLHGSRLSQKEEDKSCAGQIQQSIAVVSRQAAKRDEPTKPQNVVVDQNAKKVNDVALALRALGYKEADAQNDIRAAMSALGQEATVEDLVRACLKGTYNKQ